jgi:hypothetical protein
VTAFESTSRPPERPAEFRAAVDSLDSAAPHPSIAFSPIRPPQRLAPYAYALGAEVSMRDSSGRSDRPRIDAVAPSAPLHRDTAEIPEYSDGDAFGRLILLYDPDGDETWAGRFRLVAYVQADLEAALAADPLLPEVTWSWLVDALDAAGGYTALGGTVTATSSVRYGDIAGPERAHQLELRASWTVLDVELGVHADAFGQVLAQAAGLPPVGVTELHGR